MAVRLVIELTLPEDVVEFEDEWNAIKDDKMCLIFMAGMNMVNDLTVQASIASVEWIGAPPRKRPTESAPPEQPSLPEFEDLPWE